ncbi:MAG TPA: hypothetical protein VF571_07035 [Pyrinomonadaceae bacterium]|jgi:hypothetical protein
MISIPDRLLINGREPYQEFEPEEPLYFRFSSEHFPDETRLPVAAIRFPDFSVNRGKESQPTDVLIPHWVEFGIAEFEVRAIPLPYLSGDGRKFEFKVVHDPIDAKHPYYGAANQSFENYAHSEIRAFVGTEHQKKKIPEFIKKQFRLKMSDNTKIVVLLCPAPIVETLSSQD